MIVFKGPATNSTETNTQQKNYTNGSSMEQIVLVKNPDNTLRGADFYRKRHDAQVNPDSLMLRAVVDLQFQLHSNRNWYLVVTPF